MGVLIMFDFIMDDKKPAKLISRKAKRGERERESERGMASLSSSTKPSREEVLDAPLHVFGFEYEDISPHRVSGHLRVTPQCCQPFKALHGGVTAMVAEGLASMGAFVASGLQRVAGVQLSINHFKSAQLGDLVHAEATPLSAGKSIQVWEVRFWKSVSSNSENRSLISSSRVTILCRPMPDNAKESLKAYKKYSKL